MTIHVVKENIDISKAKLEECVTIDEFFYRMPRAFKLCTVAFVQRLPCIIDGLVFIMEGGKACIFSLKKGAYK